MLLEDVKRISGENPLACYQCGNCTGSCPMEFIMDYGPRRIIHLLQIGYDDEVLKSNTIWLCSSCYSCTYRCPRRISFTKIAYALKNIAIQKNIVPRKVKVFYETFLRHVLEFGRLNEGLFINELVFKGGKSFNEIVRDINLGMKLWRKGKIKFKISRIKNVEDIKKLYEIVRGDKY